MVEVNLKPEVFRINGEGTNGVMANVGTINLIQVKQIDLATFLHGVEIGFFKMDNGKGDLLTVKTVKDGVFAFEHGLLFLCEGNY